MSLFDPARSPRRDASALARWTFAAGALVLLAGCSEGVAAASAATPVATPTARTVTVPGLPSYLEAPAGLLEDAGPGWVLATYVPHTVEARNAHPSQVPSTEAVFLVSPEGTRYLLTEVDLEAQQGPEASSWVEHHVIAWTPGESTALVEAGSHESDVAGSTLTPAPTFATLDLTSGALTPVDAPLSGYSRFIGSFDGRTLWSTDSSSRLTVETEAETFAIDALTLSGPEAVSPDGSHYLAWSTLVDIDTRTTSATVSAGAAPHACRAVSWWAEDALLGICMDADPFQTGVGLQSVNPRWVSFTTDEWGTSGGTVVRAFQPGDPMPWTNGVRLADGDVLVPGDALADLAAPVPEGDSCADGLYRVDARGATAVLSAADPAYTGRDFVPSVVDGVVVVAVEGRCEGDQVPSTLLGYDPATGALTTLLPEPSDAATTPYWQGLTSYVVGGES
ncbi:hypothetical protein ACTHAM_001692 [Cellulomonas soli]|uniref:hypothetical protein n=1 Tax=Cellulomonas soli TaxID=931535 RepID=UPI003F84390C